MTILRCLLHPRRVCAPLTNTCGLAPPLHVLQCVCQPVQPLIKPLPTCGHRPLLWQSEFGLFAYRWSGIKRPSARLHMPLPAFKSRDAQVLADFCRLQGTRLRQFTHSKDGSGQYNRISMTSCPPYHVLLVRKHKHSAIAHQRVVHNLLMQEF